MEFTSWEEIFDFLNLLRDDLDAVGATDVTSFLLALMLFRAEVYATADLPAASASLNGMVAIEQVDSTHIKLIMYAADKRYKTASFTEA